MNRKKKLMLNTISSLIFLFTNFICAFILQKFILKTYGSEVNGLVESITQFLGAVTLLDMGVGAVVQSSLYKPLAEDDKPDICFGRKILKKNSFDTTDICYSLDVFLSFFSK